MPANRDYKEKVIQNLSNIVGKAITMRQDKIYLGVDVFYILEGSIKAVFNLSDLDSAVLRLKIFETNEQKSTKVAKGYFSDFGISENNKSAKNTKKGDETINEATSFPDLPLDQIQFAEPIEINFVRPMYAWDPNQQSLISRRERFSFQNSGEIKAFLLEKRATVEKCLCWLAMDQKCTKACSENSIK